MSLTADDVIRYRAEAHRRGSAPFDRIAALHGISYEGVRAAIRGLTWRRLNRRHPPALVRSRRAGGSVVRIDGARTHGWQARLPGWTLAPRGRSKLFSDGIWGDRQRAYRAACAWLAARRDPGTRAGAA